MSKKNNFTRGFTLLELAIVIILIGLIVVGILVGQDMIKAAKARATVAQMEKFFSSVTVFREKYGEFPGDYSLATENLTSSTQSGDGNGTIGEQAGYPTAVPSMIADSSSTNELALVFSHLSLANLMDSSFDGSKQKVRPGVNFPRPKTGSGAYMLYTGLDGMNYVHIGLTETSDDGIVTANVMRPDEAENIDRKMDDGLPFSGSVLARGGAVLEASPHADNSTPDAPACVDVMGSDGKYKLAVTSQQCQLRLRIN